MKTKNKIIVVLVLFVGFVNAKAQSTWVAPKNADVISNPLKNDQTAIKKGKTLYMQLCAVCHGDKGKGDGVASVALNPKPANFMIDKFHKQTDGAVFWKLTEGKPPMASNKESLTETQRWQLVIYLKSLKK
mgnify:CR=1 FL=1